MCLELREDGNATLLPVLAKPQARCNALLGTRNGRLHIGVTVAPENGKANAALLSLLAKSLRVSKGSLSIERGQTSREKLVRIALSREEVETRLASAVPDGLGTPVSSES